MKIVLAIVLFFAATVTVRADSTFPTDLLVSAQGFCLNPPPQQSFISTCVPTNLSLDISVTPANLGSVLITDMTGTMNGSAPITFISGGHLLDVQNYVPGFGGISNEPLYFQAMGDTWFIYLDQINGPVALYDASTTPGAYTGSWISWDVTPVFATPEPSMFGLLCVGFILCGMVFRFSVRPVTPRSRRLKTRGSCANFPVASLGD